MFARYETLQGSQFVKQDVGRRCWYCPPSDLLAFSLTNNGYPLIWEIRIVAPALEFVNGRLRHP